tara:strand:- start:28 stop:609 length:582 start_codon:yes stop_codon:yes gene_type:complete
MPRSYSRRRARKGGDSAQIIDLQSKVEKIEKQLSDVKSELNSLEKQDIESSMEKPKSDQDEEVKETKEIIEETPSDNEVEKEQEKEEEKEEKEIPLTQQKIDVTGFKGSVEDAMRSIKGKIRQLQKPSNKGRYDDKANKFKQSLDEMKSAKSISDIEDIINKTPSLNFKNNKLMGGKQTKKRRHRKGKKSRRH